MTKLRRNTLYTLLLRYFITTIEDVVYPRANGSR
jgi:hypothetical protein